MRVLVLHAHPVAESYNGALHRLIVERLRQKATRSTIATSMRKISSRG